MPRPGRRRPPAPPAAPPPPPPPRSAPRGAAPPAAVGGGPGGPAPATQAVDPTPDGRERPQRAREPELAAREELRRAVGVVQKRGGEAHPGVLAQARAQRRRAAPVHDAVGVQEQDVLTVGGGERG